jgi:hypothetical protein
VRNVTVDLQERNAPKTDPRLALARTRLLEARKELRAAAAAVAEWENTRPKPRRFAVFSRLAGDGDMTAPEEVERRLAVAQEARRVAEADLERLEAELGVQHEENPVLATA